MWLLDVSAKMVLRLLGQHKELDESITQEEIKTIIAEAESAGILESAERRMISGVMRLGERPVRGVMTPRAEVDWIDLRANESDIRELLLRTQLSRLPVGEGIDTLLGVVQLRGLLAQAL